MPLRPPEDEKPFLDERLQAERVAEGWTLMAAFSGGAVLRDPLDEPREHQGG